MYGYRSCFVGSDIRLRNGSRASQGRLEVFYKGEWGAVCDNSFDNKDATVVCRALGYSGLVLMEALTLSITKTYLFKYIENFTVKN